MVISSIELLAVACSVELGRWRLVWEAVVMVGHALATRRVNRRKVGAVTICVLGHLAVRSVRHHVGRHLHSLADTLAMHLLHFWVVVV